MKKQYVVIEHLGENNNAKYTFNTRKELLEFITIIDICEESNYTITAEWVTVKI